MFPTLGNFYFVVQIDIRSLQTFFDMDKSCHAYFSGIGNIFFMNCYELEFFFIIFINLATQYSLEKRRVPAQYGLFALILWYVEKNLY